MQGQGTDTDGPGQQKPPHACMWQQHHPSREPHEKQPEDWHEEEKQQAGEEESQHEDKNVADAGTEAAAETILNEKPQQCSNYIR